MRIQSFVPESPTLSNSIECIYIIEQTRGNRSDSFVILPSIYSYISVSLNTVSETIDDTCVTVRETAELTFDSSVQIGLKNSCVFKYNGRVRELCIKFKPLGIYDFFDKKILLKAARSAERFIPDDAFRERLSSILSWPDSGRIFSETEKYLLSRYSPFTHPYLRRVVSRLETADVEEPLRLPELSKELNISRQTLNNQFKKYLNLSPAEFNQIRRFRKFVRTKLVDKNNPSLTDLVYELGFFDQSHLIKEFKKYTFLKPNDFFRKISHSDDTHILVIWQ